MDLQTMNDHDDEFMAYNTSTVYYESCAVNLYFDDTFSFRLNLLIVGVLNILILLPTISLNFLVVLVFIRKSSLRKNGNIFLLNLSITDFLSGFFVQPVLVIIISIVLIKDFLSVSCILQEISSIAGYSLACVSLITVSGISLERYIAIFYPFVYQRTVTSRSLYIVSVLIWIFSITLVILLLLLGLTNIFFWLNTVIIATTYVWNIYVYVCITKKVREVQREVTKIRSRFDIIKLSSGTHTKATKVAGSIIISLLLCYLPQVVVSLFRVSITNVIIDKYFEYWSITFGLLNPCLNPLFYCYYNSTIRKEITHLFRHRFKLNSSVMTKRSTVAKEKYEVQLNNMVK